MTGSESRARRKISCVDTTRRAEPSYFFEDDWLFCSPPAADRLLLAPPLSAGFFGCDGLFFSLAAGFFSIFDLETMLAKLPRVLGQSLYPRLQRR